MSNLSDDIPDGVVWAPTDYESVMVLEARDASFVTVEGTHKLTRRRVPHLDSTVSRRRDDVLLIKVHDIDGSAVTDEHTT